MAKFVENTESDILCPQCNPPRKLIVKTNRHTDHQFLGCPNYPECNYTRGIPEEWIMRANGQPSLFDVLSAPNNGLQWTASADSVAERIDESKWLANNHT